MFLTGTSAAPRLGVQRFLVDPERRLPCVFLAWALHWLTSRPSTSGKSCLALVDWVLVDWVLVGFPQLSESLPCWAISVVEIPRDGLNCRSVPGRWLDLKRSLQLSFLRIDSTGVLIGAAWLRWLRASPAMGHWCVSLFEDFRTRREDW